MYRQIVLLVLVSILISPKLVAEPGDDGPPISITSPDVAVTFALGTIKNHSLYWNKRAKLLIAHITFTDAQQNLDQPNDDVHEFRLPGITFDETKGVFFATTAKGELIPVAHIKKVLFVKSIETTDNAAVRVLHPRGGNVTVILEAISPNDPAMHPPVPANGDGTHPVDINSIRN